MVSHPMAHRRRRGIWLTLSAAALLNLAPPAPAQELYILWGGQHTEDLGENTYSYGCEYLHNLSEHWVASFSWLNEGHVTNHHRTATPCSYGGAGSHPSGSSPSRPEWVRTVSTGRGLGCPGLTCSLSRT
jgi:hypothetical protein